MLMVSEEDLSGPAVFAVLSRDFGGCAWLASADVFDARAENESAMDLNRCCYWLDAG